jgi:hypothetical protein
VPVGTVGSRAVSYIRTPVPTVHHRTDLPSPPRTTTLHGQVMDDDIVIDTARLNALFDIREKFKVRVLQPAFEPIGKVSLL